MNEITDVECTGMIEAFKQPQLNSFSCVSPLNLNA